MKTIKEKKQLSTNLVIISSQLVAGILFLLLIFGIIYYKQKMKEMWEIIEWNQDYGYSMWTNFTNCANNL